MYIASHRITSHRTAWHGPIIHHGMMRRESTNGREARPCAAPSVPCFPELLPSHTFVSHTQPKACRLTLTFSRPSSSCESRNHGRSMKHSSVFFLAACLGVGGFSSSNPCVQYQHVTDKARRAETCGCSTDQMVFKRHCRGSSHRCICGLVLALSCCCILNFQISNYSCLLMMIAKNMAR